jgi:hypothetical protein
VSRPAAPDPDGSAVAVRLVATGAELEGLDITQTVRTLDDVVASVTFRQARPADIAAISRIAVRKATTALGR